MDDVHMIYLERMVAKVTKSGLVNFLTQLPHFRIPFTHQAALKCLLVLERFTFSFSKRCKWTPFHSRSSLLAKSHLAFHRPSWRSQFKRSCSILILASGLKGEVSSFLIHSEPNLGLGTQMPVSETRWHWHPKIAKYGSQWMKIRISGTKETPNPSEEIRNPKGGGCFHWTWNLYTVAHSLSVRCSRWIKHWKLTFRHPPVPIVKNQSQNLEGRKGFRHSHYNQASAEGLEGLCPFSFLSTPRPANEASGKPNAFGITKNKLPKLHLDILQLQFTASRTSHGIISKWITMIYFWFQSSNEHNLPVEWEKKRLGASHIPPAPSKTIISILADIHLLMSSGHVMRGDRDSGSLRSVTLVIKPLTGSKFILLVTRKVPKVTLFTDRETQSIHCGRVTSLKFIYKH